jgi:hypothetical protein
MATFLQRNRKRLWAIAILVVLSVGAAALILPGASGGRCKETSPKNACINNLRQIDGAKEQWALETHQPTNAPVIVSAVNQYIKGGGPKCPQGGTYTYGNIDQPPRCSISGHSL